MNVWLLFYIPLSSPVHVRHNLISLFSGDQIKFVRHELADGVR